MSGKILDIIIVLFGALVIIWLLTDTINSINIAFSILVDVVLGFVSIMLFFKIEKILIKKYPAFLLFILIPLGLTITGSIIGRIMFDLKITFNSFLSVLFGVLSIYLTPIILIPTKFYIEQTFYINSIIQD